MASIKEKQWIVCVITRICFVSYYRVEPRLQLGIKGWVTKLGTGPTAAVRNSFCFPTSASKLV